MDDLQKILKDYLLLVETLLENFITFLAPFCGTLTNPTKKCEQHCLAFRKRLGFHSTYRLELFHWGPSHRFPPLIFFWIDICSIFFTCVGILRNRNVQNLQLDCLFVDKACLSNSNFFNATSSNDTPLLVKDISFDFIILIYVPQYWLADKAEEANRFDIFPFSNSRICKTQNSLHKNHFWQIFISHYYLNENYRNSTVHWIFSSFNGLFFGLNFRQTAILELIYFAKWKFFAFHLVSFHRFPFAEKFLI